MCRSSSPFSRYVLSEFVSRQRTNLELPPLWIFLRPGYPIRTYLVGGSLVRMSLNQEFLAPFHCIKCRAQLASKIESRLELWIIIIHFQTSNILNAASVASDSSTASYEVRLAKFGNPVFLDLRKSFIFIFGFVSFKIFFDRSSTRLLAFVATSPTSNLWLLPSTLLQARPRANSSSPKTLFAPDRLSSKLPATSAGRVDAKIQLF